MRTIEQQKIKPDDSTTKDELTWHQRDDLAKKRGYSRPR
jgi:hypothetical protein